MIKERDSYSEIKKEGNLLFNKNYFVASQHHCMSKLFYLSLVSDVLLSQDERTPTRPVSYFGKLDDKMRSPRSVSGQL